MYGCLRERYEHNGRSAGVSVSSGSLCCFSACEQSERLRVRMMSVRLLRGV
jgi:hypothetical protein